MRLWLERLVRASRRMTAKENDRVVGGNREMVENKDEGRRFWNWMMHH